MAAASFSISLTIPASQTRAIEVNYILRALELIARQVGGGAGTVQSGTALDDQAVSLGTWTYTPGASS